MIRKAIIGVLTLAAVGTSLDGAVGLARQGCHWECPPLTRAPWTYDLKISYVCGELRASFGRQTDWVPWTLTPQWSCSSYLGYADISHATLSADANTWNSCRQWHFQPNVKTNRIRFPGFLYMDSRGRELHKGSRPGYPPTFACKRAQGYVRVAFWITSLLFAAYPTLAFICGPLRRWRRWRRRPTGSCVKCGYDLTGNESGVCPECGTEVEAL